jgi:transcriptional regulator with XRE-family HTH domain
MELTNKSIAFPPPVTDNLRELGQRIVVARKIQRLRQEDLSAMAGIGRSTLSEIEKGSPFVSIGNYMTVLWSLGIMNEILATELNGEERRLVASELPRRVRNG